MFYACLDDNNLCFGITETTGEVNSSAMIEIEAANSDYIGMRYDNGVFVNADSEIDFESQPDSQDAMLDELEENQLVIMNAQADLYEAYSEGMEIIMCALADLYEMQIIKEGN